MCVILKNGCSKINIIKKLGIIKLLICKDNSKFIRFLNLFFFVNCLIIIQKM